MSKKSINLLPPADQQANRVLGVAGQLRDFGILLVISLVVLATLLGATRLYLRGELLSSAEQLAAQQSLMGSAETANLKKDVETFNKAMANFQKLSAGQQQYSVLLREIANLLPADLTVDRLTISADDHKIELGGRGGSRDSVLALRARLVDSAYFKNVNFPLANLQRAQDVSWSYRFYFLPEKINEP